MRSYGDTRCSWIVFMDFGTWPSLPSFGSYNRNLPVVLYIFDYIRTHRSTPSELMDGWI